MKEYADANKERIKEYHSRRYYTNKQRKLLNEQNKLVHEEETSLNIAKTILKDSLAKRTRM